MVLGVSLIVSDGNKYRTYNPVATQINFLSATRKLRMFYKNKRLFEEQNM